MYQFATGGIFAALYIAGSIVGWRTTAPRAEGGPTVTIGSPIPLPVAVQQPGAWNAGIAGTQNVNITGWPAISLVTWLIRLRLRFRLSMSTTP